MGGATGCDHVDATVNRMNPSRTRIGDDETGRAQYRQATLDSQTRVPRFFGDGLAVGHADFDNEPRQFGAL